MENLISTLKINWVDIIFLALFIYFIITSSGFIDTVLEIIGFIFSLFFSYRYYLFFGNLLLSHYSLSKGVASALGFFIAWLITELIVYIIISYLIFPLTRNLRKNSINYLLGFPAVFFQTSIIFLFFVSLIFALPVRGEIKESIIQSRTGPYFVNLSQSFEKSIKNVFGDAVSESLNFLTIKPKSDESIDLGFKLKEDQLSVDHSSEKIMFNQVNQERIKRGIKPLELDSQLQTLAEDYGKQMFEYSFFAHVSSIDGSTPADRANKAGVEYLVIGENLAYAPDVYLAYQGLMNSEGHRANILSSEYGKVGVGVIDGGNYGKMFVQEFKN